MNEVQDWLKLIIYSTHTHKKKSSVECFLAIRFGRTADVSKCNDTFVSLFPITYLFA